MYITDTDVRTAHNSLSITQNLNIHSAILISLIPKFLDAIPIQLHRQPKHKSVDSCTHR